MKEGRMKEERMDGARRDEWMKKNKKTNGLKKKIGWMEGVKNEEALEDAVLI